MAVCKYCNQEMHEAAGCVMEPILTVDGEIDPVKYGDELHPTMRSDQDGVLRRRCGDCAALPGNYHHVGCDIEECPRCHGQLLSCDCVIEESQPTTTVQ